VSYPRRLHRHTSLLYGCTVQKISLYQNYLLNIWHTKTKSSLLYHITATQLCYVLPGLRFIKSVQIFTQCGNYAFVLVGILSEYVLNHHDSLLYNIVHLNTKAIIKCRLKLRVTIWNTKGMFTSLSTSFPSHHSTVLSFSWRNAFTFFHTHLSKKHGSEFSHLISYACHHMLQQTNWYFSLLTQIRICSAQHLVHVIQTYYSKYQNKTPYHLYLHIKELHIIQVPTKMHTCECV
jgi:hypothetical protein